MWDKFLLWMSEDYQNQLNSTETDRQVIYRTLKALDKYLHANGSSVSDYPGLPQLCDFQDLWNDLSQGRNALVAAETNYDQTVLQELVQQIPKLNEDQSHVHNTIIEAVNNQNSTQNTFFLDGPGGTGKSFVLQTILASVRSDHKIALAVATSGIASLELMGGRTAHSTFKLGLNLTPTSTCSIPAQSHRAELLRMTSLIVWDETPMMSKYGFEALDRTLQDFMDNNQVFGGKVIVLAGDFRQILAVVPKATEAEVVEICIKRSRLWTHCTTLRLNTNLRVQVAADPTEAGDIQEFADFLLRIGEGRSADCQQCGHGFAKIPKNMFVLGNNNCYGLAVLIDQIYGKIQEHFMEKGHFSGKTILTPLNTDVHVINNKVVDILPGEVHEYLSIDSVEETEGLDLSLYPVEFLNTVTISGMPPHKLRL